jgi:hypothetical protein
MPEYFDARWIDFIRRTVQAVLFRNGHARTGTNGYEDGFPEDGFWASISGHTTVSGNANRFQYAWVEQRETPTGWEDLPGGRTGTTSARFALNSIEDNNPNTGGGYDPVGTTADETPVVWMRITYDTSGNPAWRFSHEEPAQPIGDEVWTHASASGQQTEISHIGPSTATQNAQNAELTDDGGVTGGHQFTFLCAPIQFDAKGHYVDTESFTGVTAAPFKQSIIIPQASSDLSDFSGTASSGDVLVYTAGKWTPTPTTTQVVLTGVSLTGGNLVFTTATITVLATTAGSNITINGGSC